jgi:hypothetical protein
MTIRIAPLLVAAVALAAPAAHSQDEPAKLQWKPTDSTMAALVLDGYKLVSAVKEPDPHSNTWRYFLQKDQSLAQCLETHAIGAKRAATSTFVCMTLVPPYVLPAKK